MPSPSETVPTGSDPAGAAPTLTEGDLIQPERQVGVGARELLVLISSIMALMAMGIDLMLPAFDEIRGAYSLGQGSNRTGQVITVFFLGLAVAQLLYGPLADRFGRKPVLYIGVGVSMIGAAGSALAPSFELLLVSRFVWGIGAAGARVVATAIIRDRFVGPAMAKAMSQVMAVFILVPLVAPSIGAGLIAVLPWRSVFWFCVVFSAVIGIWSLRLTETLDPAHVVPLTVANSFGSYARVARTPITFGYTMATVFIQAAMTTYLAVSELIIGDIFERRSQFPAIFGVVALGFGLAAIINGRLVERRGIDAMVAAAFAINVPVGAALVAVSVLGDGVPSVWVFIPLLAVALATFMLLMPNLNTAAMTPVGEIAGSAAAFTGAMRIAGGAAIASVTTGWVTDSVTPFVVTLLGLCGMAGITVVIVRVRADRRHG